jgi:hypothetical protein
MLVPKRMSASDAPPKFTVLHYISPPHLAQLTGRLLIAQIITLHTLTEGSEAAQSVTAGYGLDGRRSTPGPGAHPISYPINTMNLSLGVERPGRETDHVPPCSAEVKYGGATSPLPHTTSWRDT